QPLPVGEPWQHGAVGTAEWKGVPLRDVIGDWFDAAEYPWLVVEGMDHGAVDDTSRREPFVRGLPMAKAMEPDTILALELNGAPLSVLRGGPVRLIVPGWYGMASVKWVSRIGVAREAFTGYFQRERYVIERPGEITRPVSRALVKSLFYTPTDEQFVRLAPLDLCGWAWSGEREITRVKVATDGSGRWTDAELKRPASPHAWTGWRLRWTPPAAGRYVLRCRATDSAGDMQPLSSAWNAHGYENNGVHAVSITVEGK
ncbi:MAG TPA: molybdopterin-dependent oxidoreductase, partial [Gemmatimonadaceae bacterium]